MVRELIAMDQIATQNAWNNSATTVRDPEFLEPVQTLKSTRGGINGPPAMNMTIPELALSFFGSQDQSQTAPANGWLFHLPTEEGPTEPSDNTIAILYHVAESLGQPQDWKTSRNVCFYYVQNAAAESDHFYTEKDLRKYSMVCELLFGLSELTVYEGLVVKAHPKDSSKLLTCVAFGKDERLFGPLEDQSPYVRSYFEKHFGVQLTKAVSQLLREQGPFEIPEDVRLDLQEMGLRK